MARGFQETVAPFLLVGAVAGGVVGVALGNTLDSAASEGIHKQQVDSEDHTITMNDSEVWSANTRNTAISVRKDSVRIVANLLDEKCRTALVPYRAGGEFADVSEDGAVVDLVGEPTAPCQTGPVQVRRIVRKVRSEDKRIANAEADAAYYAKLHQRFEEYKRDDDNFHGSIPGGITGMIIGGLRGTYLYSKRRRKNAVVETVQETPSPPEG